METNQTASPAVSATTMTSAVMEGSLATTMSPDVMMQACMLQEISAKIDNLKDDLIKKTAMLKAYEKHMGKLEYIHDRHSGGGGTKIYKTFHRIDFKYNEKTGQVEEMVGQKLKQKDPIFGKAYTPKAALAAEVERLKKHTESLRKDIGNLEADLRDLMARKKSLMDEMGNTITKKEQANSNHSRRL